MNEVGTRKFNVALALAKEFSHGWAGFEDAAEGAATLDEAFERINAAMDAWEAEDLARWKSNLRGLELHNPHAGYAGLRPSLTHETMTGRIKWNIEPYRTHFSINRPDGPVIECTISHGRRNGFVRIHDGAALGRHIEAARWMCDALGADGLFQAVLFLSSLEALREYAEIRGSDTEPFAIKRLADLEASEANRSALCAYLDGFPAAAAKI